MQQRLQQRIQAARKADGGFTLIELLIVIVILGVLAGVVVFSVQFINSRGEKAACQTDEKNVQSAVEAYYAQFNAWPTDIDGAPGTTTLVGKGVLHSAPSSTNYTIKYDGITTHLVTGNLNGVDCVTGVALP